MDPQAAFDISLRLPHLGLRMAEHSRRAHAFATRLAECGLPVTYPGLPSHADHELLRRLANPDFGFGGLLTLDLGTRERAFDFMGRLQNEHQFGLMAVSLGYSETLMSCSAASTSSEMPEDELEKAGIRPGLVRLSLGYTGTLEQRWEQLRAVLVDMGLIGSA
jgi:methionine-gamma-lyase